LPGTATGFAEGLVAAGAEVLAMYQHPHLGRWAAVTTKVAGAGRITVVGTVPDQDLAAGLVQLGGGDGYCVQRRDRPDRRRPPLAG
jgi:hypothetical protein